MIKISLSGISHAESFAKFITSLDSEGHYILYDADERKMNYDQAKKFLTRISQESRSAVFFAFNESNEIVGFICGEVSHFNRISHTMRINIGILKQYHRSGIGRLLTSSLLEHARLNGITRLEGGIIKNNTASINLFTHFGFEVEGIKRNSIKIGGVYYDEYFLANIIA